MLSEANKKVVILIPSLNPKKEFINYIEELIDNGFKNIIVVNDGSNNSCNEIFDNIEKRKECKIIKHTNNEGKGKSLKDGLKLFKTMKGNFNGIITADCDGQHLIKDIIKLSEALKDNKNNLILGVRNLKDKNVPIKSRIGNNLTSAIFKLLYGVKITDTQTGLRAIPTSLLDDYIELKGNRYEYETNMLIYSILKRIKIIEIPIDTVYIDENKGTHFRPIKDSILIYKNIFSSLIKYSIASIISFLLDIFIFKILLLVTQNFDQAISITIGTIGARVISSLVNYTLNRNITFKNKGNVRNTIIKYYALCIFQMSLSAILVIIFSKLIKLPETLIKIIVDTILYFFSYRMQNKWVFNSKKK